MIDTKEQWMQSCNVEEIVITNRREIRGYLKYLGDQSIYTFSNGKDYEGDTLEDFIVYSTMHLPLSAYNVNKIHKDILDKSKRCCVIL